MNGIRDLLRAIEKGSLMRPEPGEPNLVAFARALVALGGGPASDDPAAASIAGTIGESEHLVCAVVDGLGMNFVRRLARDSFVRSHLRGTLRSVFPSSTGPALFAVASCSWPGTHGFLGWTVHLPALDTITTPYLWIRSHDRKPLSELGLAPEEVFLGARAFDAVTRDFRVYLPEQYIGSPASVRSFDPARTRGASSFPDAVDKTLERVRNATGETFTYLYTPVIDSTAHDLGESHPDTLAEVQRMDAELARLHAGLPPNARLVVTADHGHSDVPTDARIRVDPDEPLARALSAPPSGEPRVPYFRVREDAREGFRDLFAERLGAEYYLLSTQEADDLRLFGPEGLTERVRPRVGDFVGIARSAASVEFCRPGRETWLRLNSMHGGMTPDEVLVPLVLA